MKNIEIRKHNHHDVTLVIDQSDDTIWGYYCQNTKKKKKETTLELLETSPEIDNKSFQIKCIIQYMIQV